MAVLSLQMKTMSDDARQQNLAKQNMYQDPSKLPNQAIQDLNRLDQLPNQAIQDLNRPNQLPNQAVQDLNRLDQLPNQARLDLNQPH